MDVCIPGLAVLFRFQFLSHDQCIVYELYAEGFVIPKPTGVYRTSKLYISHSFVRFLEFDKRHDHFYLRHFLAFVGFQPDFGGLYHVTAKISKVFPNGILLPGCSVFGGRRGYLAINL